MKKFIWFLSIFGVLVFMSGCGEKESQKSIQKADIKPYEGQSIMVIVPKLHAGLIRGPVMEQAKIFEEKTGSKIRVVTPGWNETIAKTKESLTNPNLNYDIFVVIAMWNGMLMGGDHVAPVPQWAKDKIEWDDVLPIYKESVLSWNSTAYGMPYDGDCINLYYRKDIFENEENRAKFLKEYEYELSPPTTWKNYKDIAKFFNGWDWDGDGKIEYGNTGLRKKGDVSMLQFFAQAAAYAKHPDDKAYFFDPDTMQPRINNLGFIKALEDYIEVVKYGPKGW